MLNKFVGEISAYIIFDELFVVFFFFDRRQMMEWGCDTDDDDSVCDNIRLASDPGHAE